MTNWKVYRTSKRPLDGFVISVSFGCELHDEGRLVDRYVEEIEFNQQAGDFIPYEELTESTVLGWIEGRLGHVFMAQIENQLINRFNTRKQEEQSAPVVEKPW